MNRKKFLLILVLLCLFQGTSVYANGAPRPQPRPPETRQYQTLDARTLTIFNQLSNVQWEQFVSIPNPGYAHDPSLYVRNLTWRKTLRLGLNDNNHSLVFECPTWRNTEGLTSGGGGYAASIPIVQSGYRLQNGSYEFFIWARHTGFVDPNSNRLHLEIIQPYVVNATSFADIERGRNANRECIPQEIAIRGAYGCTTVDRVFDYLIVRYNPTTPTQLRITGRTFGTQTPIWEILFTAHQQQ